MPATFGLACWIGSGHDLSTDGQILADPDALLEAWRDAYEPPAGERLGFYTTLHGASFEQAVRDIPHTGPS